MNIQQLIERTRRHQQSYAETGLIGVYDHVLLKEQIQLADSLERLNADNLKLRKIAAHVPAKIYIQAKEKAGYASIVEGQSNG